MVPEQVDIHMQKKESRQILHPSQKLKMDHKPKCKM